MHIKINDTQSIACMGLNKEEFKIIEDMELKSIRHIPELYEKLANTNISNIVVSPVEVHSGTIYFIQKIINYK